MPEVCTLCKKNPSAEGKTITFRHPERSYLEFTIEVSRRRCKQCVSKNFIDDFDEYCRGLVMKSGKKIKINWELLVDKERRATEKFAYAVTERIYRSMMLTALVALRRLTLEPEGNWEVVDKWKHHRYKGFFPRREDAMAYAKALNSSSPVQVRRIEKVIEISGSSKE